MLRLSRALPAFLVSVLIATASQAQTGPSAEDRALAEALFQEGRTLIEGGNTAAACRKFEESYRMDKAPGTLLNMARCHQLEGRVATSWAEFFQVAAEARRDGRDDREKVALESIRELEPRIPKLVILVPPESRIDGLTVTRNGTQLGRASWGTETPVDPGEILVEAEAPGYRKWTHRLTLEEAGQKQVTIPALVLLPKPKEPPKPPPAPISGTSNSTPRDPGSPASQTVGVLIGGVGLVGIGVGSYFGLRAIDKRSKAEERCTLGPDGNGCSEGAVDLNREARDAARFANLGIGVGVVAVVAGTYLYFAGAPSGPVEQSDAARKPVDVGVAVLPGGGFASLTGGW